MKKLNIVIFLICSIGVLLYSCSPAKRVVWHTDQIAKLVEKHPDLKRDVFDTAFSEKRDTADIDFNIDSIQTDLQIDTTVISELAKDLVNLEDSIHLLKGLQQLDKEKIKELEKRKQKTIERVVKEAIKDTTYNVEITQKIKTKDTIYTNRFNLIVSLKDGKLQHQLEKVDYKLPTTDINVSITATNEKISLFAWIRYPLTLSLIFVILILSFIVINLFRKR